ncbi:LysR family transcriptional regulator [Bordetella holmesii]|uniref:LysR substrate-binding domain protein n=2 Tax=Bordetella holmesii TaxID=35814 RepID=A0A158M3T9_9BORD|nr:LysR family transcriptional regulator [Bordetella holmesii]AHV92766.1 bacterial regulatory helix-turn-helix, lysR family protein [Bordetella holmesii ATCC 51541]AIT28464.1 bacterial regulatory helix-turn-helix, lysR family protein [Bordetella holmesii 44057]EWM41254.1 bacterial regulatory helix-turn-helix, lysR family protein [Bordetella holmesii 35009]EWM43584.1 bacterial regulatory helix-turn-helix, lysR family protein [Bordetella holmesii 41130]AMD47120.1 LysR family transcriptional regu
MELRQLEAFAAVMSSGSITAAGRLLGRSQPSITRSIQELEAEIGYPLFLRSGPRVTPTEQGFLLYEDVAHALSSLRHIQTRAHDIAQGKQQPLRLAATSALAAGLLPHAIARAEANYGVRAMQVRSVSPEQVLHAVLTGSAQLGLTSLPLEHRGLDVHWIGQAACVVALPDVDPLAQHATVPVAALAGRRFITLANPYRLRGRLDRALAQAAAGLIESNSSLNALAAVRAGLGVAILEPVSALGLPVQGVAIRAIDQNIPFFFGVVTPQSTPIAPTVAAMAEALAQTAATLLPGFIRHEASAHAGLLHSIHGKDDFSTDPI